MDFLTGPEPRTGPEPSTGPDYLPPTPPLAEPTSIPAAPRPRILRRSVFMLVGALALVGATVLGASAMLGDSPQLLKGTVALTDLDGLGGGASSCYGKGGYSDLESGAQVNVKNGDGKLLATTVLGEGAGETLTDVIGRLAGAAGVTTTSSYSSTYLAKEIVTCTFPFETKVPKGEKFYSVTVGSSGRRGTLSYSKDELDKKHWTVELTIGS